MAPKFLDTVVVLGNIFGDIYKIKPECWFKCKNFDNCWYECDNINETINYFKSRSPEFIREVKTKFLYADKYHYFLMHEEYSCYLGDGFIPLFFFQREEDKLPEEYKNRTYTKINHKYCKII